MTKSINQWRIYLWTALAALLALPAIAMMAGAEGVAWGPGDFLIMTVLLGLLGLGIEFVSRVSKSARGKAVGIGVAVLAFLWLWAELAVGVFTNLGS
ncbi:hypothetical protein [Sphingomicrobium clamense]|uniref:Uncharacterized protein n=1 Tax=Sphingomicrobium clamense TaxID=2851013 RepID=A0ABS6V2H7_9SPHN|nr:hypothetical protein [Sphingomicrobium sp. B8]MBW0143770.1 hypothetical protein [Sphingomicrobium sp. B8]